MRRLGLLCHYFVAPSDGDAASTIDRVGGPGQPVTPAPPRLGWFRRRADTAALSEAPLLYPTADGGGIEPVVQMGTLEELLTERSYDEVMDANPGGEIVAMRGEGERWVAKLTDPLTDALAQSSSSDLARVAEPWAQTEEFWGSADSAQLLVFLQQLSGLARQAREQRGALYCWVSR